MYSITHLALHAGRGTHVRWAELSFDQPSDRIIQWPAQVSRSRGSAVGPAPDIKQYATELDHDLTLCGRSNFATSNRTSDGWRSGWISFSTGMSLDEGSRWSMLYHMNVCDRS